MDKRYNKETERLELKLIDEIAGMRFSFKKLLKVIELDAVVSFYNR